MDSKEPVEPTLARLMGYLPAITTLAVLVLSVFNIGYFSKVGLHFLGVMDLTNLVYSLSFIIAIMAGSLGVYWWGDYFESLLKNIGEPAGRKKIAWIVGVFVVMMVTLAWGLFHFYPSTKPVHFLGDRLAAVAWVVMSAMLVAAHYVRWTRTRRIGIGNGFFSFVVVALTIYWVGRAVAEHELYIVTTSYAFTLKDRTVPMTGKILRASSSGFLVFTGNRVAFLPLGEIKEVKAADELVD
ncbi:MULTISPECIES: hypothetical protein [Bradyrhizobium]|uniref:hypothetical protein n=1 Tax=Bradyrhizobium TaxID=374 RepID=UPI001008905B|nr:MULTISPECIES: hypothetical protein [Bradyrhizobium]MDA9400907.1 hypothetical protein [Bradyrhizobium sp. CCBAU 45389]MDA9527297.1 hypothetical protein [Bradyrhizobium sp. CCBAU 25338]